MGLFHDVCPDCGAKVPKRARFCSNCGRGAPGGWTKCPGCGKWVGNDSAHCPCCDHPLHPDDRVDIAGGVWDREPGMFAQRFELADVSRVAKDGLMIQEGTVAILLDGGREVKTLGPGRHTPEGLLRSINWFGNPPPRSAVMVDSGDLVFSVEFPAEGTAGGDGFAGPRIRSAEELPVGAFAEITLRFDQGKAESFLENFMKQSRTVSSIDLCRWLYAEAVSAVKDVCLQSTIEDLVKDPDRRERFEEAISRALKEPMSRCGLSLVRVGAVEFCGEAYEDMRAKYGELEVERRKVEFQKKQLELLAGQDAMMLEEERRGKSMEEARAKLAQDAGEYLAQLAQEKGLSGISRDVEMQIAVRSAKGEVSRVDAEQEAARELESHAKAMTALAHKLELDLTLKNYDREQLLADARNKAALAAIGREEALKDEKNSTAIAGEKLSQAEYEEEAKRRRIDTEIYEADKWLSIKAKKEAIKNSSLRERADILSGRSAQELAAISEDAAARAQFLQHDVAKEQLAHEERMAGLEAGLTPEQLLARQAGRSSAAATAYAQAAQAKENASAAVLAEIKKAEADRIAHDEKMLEKMADIAKTSVEHQSTTVIPPQQPSIVQH